MFKVLSFILIFISSASYALEVKCKNVYGNPKMKVDMKFYLTVSPDNIKISQRKICDEQVCSFDSCICAQDHLDSVKIEQVIADGYGFISDKAQAVKLTADVDFTNDLMFSARGQSDSYVYLISGLTNDLDSFGRMGNPFVLDTKTNIKQYIACRLTQE